MRPQPPSGLIDSGTHLYACRVYFEDTDFSGVVYHANYLRFMERARSDLLRVLGIEQRAAFEAGEGVYAVADLAIRYVAPARLDDALLVETWCTALGGASVTMRQRVLRDAVLLSDATVRVGFLTRDGRPRRQPAGWVELFRGVMAAEGKDLPPAGRG